MEMDTFFQELVSDVLLRLREKYYLEKWRMRKFLRALVSDVLLRLRLKSYSEKRKMHTLTPELVSDILLRLPVKSLLRFRCLSTSLCSEIDSPYFVNSHLNRSIRNQIHRKLIVDNRNATHFYTMKFDDDLKKVAVLNYPFKSRWITTVGGSCNGLILLVLGKLRKFTLWNPFTRRYKKVPPCPFEPLPTDRKTKYLLGLGHDSALDDYKIVVVLFVGDFFHSSFPSWVFSLKRNSWRRIQDAPVKLEDKLSSQASFANGALYWQYRRHKIFGFDLTNEVFFNIPLSPDSGIVINGIGTPKSRFYYDTMAVFEGKLYSTKISADTLEFYLHESDKGGEEGGGCWKKAFEMDGQEIERALYQGNRFLLPRPLAYSKNGDSILFYKENEVFWYNPETKSWQWVEILGIPLNRMYNFSFNVCWESLVPLGNEDVFDAAPEIRSTEKLREIAEILWEIAAPKLTGMNLARLACILILFHFYSSLLLSAVDNLWK